jgi:hypothetical protein
VLAVCSGGRCCSAGARPGSPSQRRHRGPSCVAAPADRPPRPTQWPAGSPPVGPLASRAAGRGPPRRNGRRRLHPPPEGRQQKLGCPPCVQPTAGRRGSRGAQRRSHDLVGSWRPVFHRRDPCGNTGRSQTSGHWGDSRSPAPLAQWRPGARAPAPATRWPECGALTRRPSPPHRPVLRNRAGAPAGSPRCHRECPPGAGGQQGCARSCFTATIHVEQALQLPPPPRRAVQGGAPWYAEDSHPAVALGRLDGGG